MSAIKKLLKTSIQKQEIEEYLKNELKDAIFGGVDIAFTPIGTRVTIYAMRPGRVIGSKGRVIKEISSVLESRFGVENPQVTVAEVEVPELNPYVMAQRIASAIERGARYRRVAFWALRRIMDAGAKGAEIEISGKLTSARARSEKYSEGIMPKSGDPAEKYVKRGTASVLLKTGLYGIKVSIYPPDAPLSEEVKMVQPTQAEKVGEGSDQGA